MSKEGICFEKGRKSTGKKEKTYGLSDRVWNSINPRMVLKMSVNYINTSTLIWNHFLKQLEVEFSFYL